MSNESDIGLWAVIGFGFGIVSFFRGFRIYREFRVLEDTPEIPVRSIAMGLVHIHGKATGENLVESPVTRCPCHFFQVVVERWVESKNGGHWAHYTTHADGPLFYLDDGSGKVLVDAHKAEYDLLQTAKRQTGGGRVFTSLVTLWDGSRTSNLPSLAGAFVSEGDLLSYVQSLPGGSRFSLASMAGNFGLGGSSRYRLTEYLILPGHWYDVTGTCAENSQAKDEHDRNLIKKGENEPTFLISWRNEKGIEAKLRNRAALYIFGGAALAVVSLAVLLGRLGWY